jgi:hypothetical protein
MRFPPGTIKRVRRVKLKASGKTELLDYCERKDGRKACLKLNVYPSRGGHPSGFWHSSGGSPDTATRRDL